MGPLRPERGGQLEALVPQASAQGQGEKYARDKAVKLEKGEEALERGKVTLAQVFALYLENHSPTKCETEQRADKRRAKLWTRWLGGDVDPHHVSLAQWQGFISARSSGAINARGKRPKKARPVRARTVEADCIWLNLVFRWAVDAMLSNGATLMRSNPLRRKPYREAVPREKNPRRPVASQDRLEAIREATDRVMMEVRWRSKREERRSYLSEILDIVNGTGRRIRAVCQLRYDDLRLERTEAAPHGAIRWPADTDKTGHETLVPISPTVRAALDRVLRDRPGLGRVPLFPSPTYPQEPISRHLADDWLREAERLAEVEPQEGSLWHAYRRKWATERKHLPDADVMAAGGWQALDSLKQAYQQADAETMLSVVMGAGELREAK